MTDDPKPISLSALINTNIMLTATLCRAINLLCDHHEALIDLEAERSLEDFDTEGEA